MTRKGPGNNPTAKDPFGFETQSGTHFGAGASYHCHVEGQDTTHCNHVVRQITLGTIRIVEAFLRVHIIVGLLLGAFFFCLVGGLKKPDKGQEER